MKYLNLCLLAIGLFASATLSKAQTLDEVLAKYVTAIGGKENIKKINSVYIENTLQVMGQESSSKMVILNGKGSKTISDIMGQKMVQCYTDKSGWMINPMMGSSEPADMPSEQYNAGKSSIYAADPLSFWSDGGYKAELAGKEKVGAADAFKVKLVSPENVTTYYFIDATTYYPVQMTMTVDAGGQSMNMTTTFSDYRKTDSGIIMPFSTEVDYGGQFNISLKTKKIEYNKAVDPAIFEKGNLSL
jgi:phosphotransferase system IIB component